MIRGPIQPRIQPGDGGEGGDEPGGPADPDAFREALSYWASGVTVAAVREDGGSLHATTVSSFLSVSADPPRVLISLGAGAQILPFLQDPSQGESSRFVVNFLAADQARLATMYADSFPVGTSPFPEEGEPVAEGGLYALVCRVERVLPVDSGRLVLGRVVRTVPGTASRPLVNYRRRYGTVTDRG